MTTTMVPGLDGAGNGSPDLLDAYSGVVSSVVAILSPAVASLRVGRNREGGAGRAGAGSAVVVAPDGLLVTSAHVVGSAEGGSAAFGSGAEWEFDVAGTDPFSDLAVLRLRLSSVAEEPPPAATLGDAGQLVVGQLVVAVGNPLGFAGSVSAGVVSGLGRSLAASSGSATRVVDDVIQTDAALHPGNSGGALADGRARVVGINTAVVGHGVGQGLGMAIPVNSTTRRIIASLIKDGRVRRAHLGIGGGARPLPTELRRDQRRTAIAVTMVVGGSPAARAGIRTGDMLLSVDGQPVDGVGDLQELMTETSIGRSVPVTVWRGGRLLDLVVVPEELAT
ncbi:MAG TPA: trypsin-like peptidase domain-containing protein [Acidimicrobiales bacterium]|jgi:serine protease Do|nr:trypsin-like peptidase domain-containing protein [Acidimicrobiales bacterium]